MAKDLAQLKRLAKNPFYALSPEDKLALEKLESEGESEDENSKKKLSRSGSVAAREIGKIEMHPQYPTEE